MKMKLLWMILVIMNSLSGISQQYVGLSVRTDSVTIGEPFALELTISISDDVSVSGTLDFSALDTLTNLMYESDTSFFNKDGDISIVPGGSLNVSPTQRILDISKLPFKDWGGEKVLKETINVAIYDVGQFQIPNPTLRITDSEDILPTSPPIVNVYLPQELQKLLQDSITVAPIKPIIDEPLQFEDFRLLLISLGILLLAVALVYITRKRKKAQSIEEKEEIVLPAHEIAFEKLSELRSKELWQKGKIKAYQSELTFIIREYLENRYEINALELTTDEILRKIPSDIDDQKLRNILQIADMVKFAKANPPADIHDKFMQEAYELVKSTVPEQETEDD